jgi:hypothetical protein
MTLIQPTLPGIDITTTGARTSLATPEQLLAGLTYCRTVGAAWRWVVGDLVLALVDGDPTRLPEAWVMIEGLDIDNRPSLGRSVALALRIEPERRREELSWSHHEAVAFMEADDQDRWLARAVDQRLTVASLTEAIAAELHPDDDPDDEPPSLLPRVKRTTIATMEQLWALDPSADIIVHPDGSARLVADA